MMLIFLSIAEVGSIKNLPLCICDLNIIVCNGCGPRTKGDGVIGEIKRVVSSLLLQIDALPSYVITIAATNHDSLLDKAVWRRFQLKLELPKPTRANLERWFSTFEKRMNFSFGLEPSTLAKKLYGRSYAEAEEFALSVYRKYLLRLPSKRIKPITNEQLRLYGFQTEDN